MDQSTEQIPQKLEFLVQADGAFFAQALCASEAGGSDLQLFLENSKGELCGVVPGAMGRGSSGGSGGTAAVVFCADSTLLTAARYYRLGGQPRQKLAPLLRHGIAPDKAWRSKSPTQRVVRIMPYVRRGLALLASGQFSAVLEKSRRYLSASRVTPPVVEGESLQAWIERLVPGQARLVLMVDHGLGGGATHYCRKIIAEALQEGEVALLVTSDPLGGSCILNLHSGAEVNQRRSDDLSALYPLPEWRRLTRIVYNTAGLFVFPLALVALMIQLQRRSEAKLTVLFHDYFPLCPSIFLIGLSGSYCGVPDDATCRRCLPNNTSMPEPLRHYRHYDPVYWRQAWGCLLPIADDIVAFSHASTDIVRKVWPELNTTRLRVVPHEADLRNEQPVRVVNTAQLHIGIVGQIGPHKGVAVITALAAAIKRRKLNIRISVIGDVEASVDSAVVSETGHYEREDLPQLLADSGANVMLFPSVWPETFSYVVQELMTLQLPVACFDMGAPAERVRDYGKGLILASSDADTMLDQLMAFHKRLYSGA